eukprot:COSAG06_NODE_1231_length_10153_cov_60.823623_8_plen_312_part_00
MPSLSLVTCNFPPRPSINAATALNKVTIIGSLAMTSQYIAVCVCVRPCVRCQSMSDSDSGSDSDLETIGLAAAARASSRPRASQQQQQQQQQQPRRGSTAAAVPGGEEEEEEEAAAAAAAAPAASQYVPASVELLAALQVTGGGGGGEGQSGQGASAAYSWHAAAAEFGAAESSLGAARSNDSAGAGAGAGAGADAGGQHHAEHGVRAVASDPPYADVPLHNANAVRGAVAIVQRGLCTFLDKARRVQEAGGVGVIFVNSAETLFVPHGTDDDPGGDIRIPAVCLRKKDGEALLAIASLGHQGAANIAMRF